MRSSVRARSIFLVLACISASVVSARVARGEGSSTSTGSTGETDDDRFRRLKAEGDRALAEGRLNDAIRAYHDARSIKRDPLVAGRMGLALVMWEEPKLWVRAAGLLHDAVAENAGVNMAERRTFWEAFERVRRHVCKIEVETNVTDAVVDIGNHNPTPSPSAFWAYVAPGKHELIARVEGRGEIRKPYECVNGNLIEIEVEFPPLIIPEGKTITVTKGGKETIKIVHVPIPVENPIAKPESNGNRLSVLLGPNVIFGVAPSPAWGLSLLGAYNFGNWSAMLGARGAYAFGPIEGHSIDVLTFAPVAGPCFRERWFTVCAVASLNFIKGIPTIPTTNNFSIRSPVTPGIGIGVGGRHSLSKRIGLYVNGDASVLSRDVELVTLQPSGVVPVWNGGQFLATVSLGVELAP